MAIFQPGTHVAGHMILRLLATGKVAEVYEVITQDGARRALKILRSDLALPSKPQARLGQEAEAVAMIEHVNVVRFHDAGVVEGRVWLLLELVEGPDLRVLLREAGGTLPVARAVSLVRQACEGVAAAHALGILHRDLKPENILVAPGDLAKVADFGAAKLSGWGVKTTNDRDISSCFHVSPEYLLHHRAEPRSDVYALGLVLYEAIAGENPIAPYPMTAPTIWQRHIFFDPPPLASAARDVPGDLSTLVQCALSKKPEGRCSMREMADALAFVLHRLNASRRAVARALPLPDRAAALARTEPAMPLYEVASGVSRGGTIRMAAVDPPVEPIDREALLPPPSPKVFAATLRSPTYADPTPPPVAPPAAEAERRSTAVPVARAAARPSKGSRPSLPVVGAACALLVLGLLSAGWLLVGRGGPSPAVAPISPVVSATTPPAGDGGPPAAPAADAGSPATTASSAPAAPPRRRASPPRSRPSLP